MSIVRGHRKPEAVSATTNFSAHKHRILVLQGGGALGAYQAGVYEGLDAAGFAPKWVAGVSIGAINSALIAGNPPERRIERLREFWMRVSAQSPVVLPAEMNSMRPWMNRMSATSAMVFGIPGFYQPRPLGPYLAPEGSIAALSFYDTEPLRATLDELVDFDLVNDGAIRLSLGAVNVCTGESVYFDSKADTITASHVMASGALPPGFPPVEIDGEHYWDGGIYSNTPLQHVLDYSPRRSRLTFQVDVFQAQGRLPSNLDEFAERYKDIRYSSRTQICSDAFRDRHEVRHAINELHKLLPPDLANTEQAKRLYEHGCVTEMDIVQLVYRPIGPQGASKDHEFSRASKEKR